MSDPKPWDDARIREGFIYDGGEAEFHDPIHGAQTQRQIAGEIFDRWLVEHDERVRGEQKLVYQYRARHPQHTEGLKDDFMWTRLLGIVQQIVDDWGPEAWIERRIVGPIERVEMT